MDTELPAIEAAVQTYFDGLYEGDTEKLARVFHPRASLFIEEGGALLVTPVPDWLARVAGRPSPVSQDLARDDRILMIDRPGPVNALVKVQCQVAPKVYVDHLSLIKVEGRWQVVAKSYCQTALLA
ncbi:nuclear transport factor 2 family protein [Bosea sp. TWI1241]|jgi:hypothetical protein|uniref:nuclear transport factor 2 family protein n=1 Tax=Bosea sp. TWI1241 TaxID=3148904 RepID=UPI0032086D85